MSLEVQPSDSPPDDWLVEANDRVSGDHQMDLQVCGGVGQGEGESGVRGGVVGGRGLGCPVLQFV